MGYSSDVCDDYFDDANDGISARKRYETRLWAFGYESVSTFSHTVCLYAL